MAKEKNTDDTDSQTQEGDTKDLSGTTLEPKKKDKFYVTSDTFKSMVISGINGSKITFDEKGMAEVTETDYKRLSTMKEFKQVK
jgi:hypothetical protein